VRDERISIAEVHRAGLDVEAVSKWSSQRKDTASRTHTSFEHGDLVSLLDEFEGSNQAGHAGTHHDDPLGCASSARKLRISR
jgi:hypothetical protein